MIIADFPLQGIVVAIGVALVIFIIFLIWVGFLKLFGA